MTSNDPARDSTLVVAYMINLDATTGRFVGFGSLVDTNMVILHSSAVGPLLADSPTSQLKVRLQIGDRSTEAAETQDGTVYFGEPHDGVELPPAVVLERAMARDVSDTYVHKPPAQLAALLADDEANDPEASPFPVPGLPNDLPVGAAGWNRPPWCIPFPNCPGCR